MTTPDTADSTPAADPTDAAGASGGPAHRYDARLADRIERRWQDAWAEAGTFRTPNPGDPDFDPSRPKFYCLDMFPYPSGAGLHVGHPEGYTATDIICRFRRLQGDNVLHPMGWDAFGLPAEQYAIQTGVHPAKTTTKAIDTFRRQLQRFGFSYDWDREFATIDPDYYRWTQWIWLQAYGSWYDPSVGELGAARPVAELESKLAAGTLVVDAEGAPVEPGAARGATRTWDDLDATERRAVVDGQRLAYLGEQTVNWCPKLGTALANEEVIDGRSERGSFPVLRKPLRQWMFRITAYAERLLRDMDGVAWPESTRTMQREWIGRSEGAEVDFPLARDGGDPGPVGAIGGLRVYTTRPDTIFGATYMVVAPEHPLVDAVLESPLPGTDREALQAYVIAARNRADVDRMADTDEKTGVASGAFVRNPATGEAIPIWVADYVLMGYGTGAIMAVPAHDQRDLDFARAFDLPVRDVVRTADQAALHAACTRALTTPELTGDRLVEVLASAVSLMREDRDAASIAQASGTEAPPTPEAADAAWAAATATEPGTRPEGTNKKAIAARRRWITEAIAAGADRVTGAGTNADVGQAFCAAIAAGAGNAWTGAATADAGRAVASRTEGLSLDGLETDAAKDAAIEWVERTGIGRRTVNFKLRDWLFSRQRYWGEPFPIVFDEAGHHHPIDPAHLPVELPDLADYEPVESDDPVPLLAKATTWLETTAGAAGVSPDVLPPDTPVRREANTMPGWAGSCWYYLRYCDPKNAERFVDRDVERYWMRSRRDGAPDTADGPWQEGVHHTGGVDLYVGGAEHAVLHLLYARFWHKILFDLGEVETPEPFGRLFHQGLITAYAFQRGDKTLVPTDEVDEREDGTAVERATGEPVQTVVAKMSKSLKNVVNPDDVIADYGADTFRLYEMYMGPLEASKPWNTQDIAGPYRFLQRTWRLVVDEASGALALRDTADDAIETALHRTIDRVADAIDRISLNTAIAAMIEFVNAATKAGGLTRDQLARFVLVLSPFAPHVAEELWSMLGGEGFAASQSWPAVDPERLRDDDVELPIQVNGKVRGKIVVPADAAPDAIEAIAREDDGVIRAIGDATIRKVIVVPGRIVNIIAK